MDGLEIHYRRRKEKIEVISVSQIVNYFNVPSGGMSLYLLPSGKNFILAEDYTVMTSVGPITVPAGFKTDLASIPKIFWSIVSPLEKHFPAAVLHDYFYRIPESRIVPVINEKEIYVTREAADNIFLEEMWDLRISWWKRWIMYRAVQLGGNSSWIYSTDKEER